MVEDKGWIRKVFMAKAFLRRSNTYVTVFNTGMIVFIALSQLENLGYNIRIGENLLLIYGLGTLGMFFLGWMDFKLGFDKIDAGIGARRNKYEMEVVRSIREIKKDIKELKKKKEKGQ